MRAPCPLCLDDGGHLDGCRVGVLEHRVEALESGVGNALEVIDVGKCLGETVVLVEEILRDVTEGRP